MILLFSSFSWGFRVLSTLAFVLIGAALFAQTTISGAVVAEDGRYSLVGATVIEQQTKHEVVTNKDGRFELVVKKLPVFLRVNLSGYTELNVKVGKGNQSLLLALTTDVNLESETVTARRVEEDLQDVPVSITTFGSQNLVERGASQLTDVARLTPGFTIENGQNGAAFGTSVFMRGIGQTDFSGATDPGVGIYVDGVYLPRTVGTLLEMEGANVEVLRGPQGTSFGRNTIGGAINITTFNPTMDSLFGSAEMTAGNFNLLQFRGSVNLPINEQSAANFSAVYRNRDGYTERLQDPGQAQGDDNTLFLRGKFLTAPTDRLTLNVGADYTRTRAGAMASTLAAADPSGSTSALLYNQLLGNAVNPALLTGNPYTTNATGPSINDLDAFGLNATANYDRGSVNSKLILGYRNMDTRVARDADNGPFDYLHADTEFSSESISAELQFHNSKPSKFEWLAGVYFMNERNDELTIIDEAEGLFDALEAANPGDVPAPYGGAGNFENQAFRSSRTSMNAVEATNLAAYLNLNYAFGRRFSASGGLRFSQDAKTLTAQHQRTATDVFIVPAGTTIEDDWASLTGHVALEYQASKSVLTYLSFAHGFKSGGFSTRPLQSTAGIVAFNPETVRVLELGAKADIGTRSRLNVSGYITDFADIHVDSFTSSEIVVQNGAKGEFFGAEVEFLTQLGKDLHFNASASFIDAYYLEVNASSNLTLETAIPKTPANQYAAGLAYTPTLSDRLGLSLHVDYSFQDDTFHDLANSAALFQPAFLLVSTRVAFVIDQKYELALWGKNLTDEAVLQGGTNFSALGITEAFYGAPRTFGAAVKYRF